MIDRIKNKLTNTIVVNAVKEGLRTFLMAVVPLLVIGLENGSLDVRAALIAGVIALLRFVDKALHEYGSANSTKTQEHWATTGLTRF